MGNGPARTVIVRGTSTRVGIPRRDKAELRGYCQDAVHEFTTLRRERLLPVLRDEHPDWTEEQLAARLDELQPLYPEWDPVVELGVVAADHRNPPELRKSAMAEQAQYLRPKLKSIEMTVDPQGAEERERRSALAQRLVGLLDAAAEAKRGPIVEGTARRPTARDSETPASGEGPGDS